AALLSLYPVVAVLVAESLVLKYDILKTTVLVTSTGLFSLVIGVLALHLIERLGRSRGVSPLKSVRAFMRTWLTGNHEDLEDLIRSFGVVDKVRIRTLVFKLERGEPIALVFPDIHFGPFRNVGSSRFLYALEENLEPYMEVFVFHTPGSHERNIATSSESYEVAKAVASSIRSYYNQLSGYGMCKPEVIRDGGWEVHALRGPTSLVYFFTNIQQGSDDLPFSIWRKAEEVLKSRQELNLVAVADSHSAKGPPVRDSKELLNLIEKIGSMDRCAEEDFYVGYGEVTGVGCRELCYDKVKVLSFRFSDGEKYAVVYLYGNNVDIKTRDNIVNLMKKLGYSESLVATPDDHSCAASFKEKPYYVVSGCSNLYDAISRAAEIASENESRAEYVTLENIFHEVELAGQNVWKLTSLIEDLGRTTIRALFTTIVLVNALAVLPMVLKL
ncbi:MAG: DUF2070 family protein, partial [Sulfolobales archaeon]|nr:DUF2070 family protein [Sulfolobales archaeon]